MSQRVLGWGLLGTARINRMVIPALRVSPGNRLMAVASRDAQKAGAYAREWGIERAHGSYQSLLDDPAVDVVYVPLPNHLHAEWTIRAIQAGKHVLCEKPITLSVEELDRVESAAREAGVVVAEAFMYRHHPQTLEVKRLLDSGAIGSVRFVRGSHSFLLSRPNDVRLRPEWGGGCLWDVGCYPVSFARFLLGAEPVEVFGSAVPGPTGVDQTFAGQLVFPGGIPVQIDAGIASPLRTEMEVVGTAGVIRVRSPYRPRAAQPILLARGDETETVTIEPQDRFRLEIEDLAEAAGGRRLPLVSLAESRGNVRAIQALYESARTGRPVRL